MAFEKKGQILRGIVLGGAAGGKKRWVSLDLDAMDKLGRRNVSGKKCQDMIHSINAEPNDRVVLEMTSSTTIREMWKEADYDVKHQPAAMAAASEPQVLAEMQDFAEAHGSEDLQELLAKVEPQTHSNKVDLTPPADMFPCIPEADDGYVLPLELAEPLGVILELLKVDDRLNVLFTGPQGTGKTTLAKVLAEELGYNFIKVDCGAIREQGDWWTRIVASNGSTHAIPTQLVYGMTTPNTVVLLDEINRTNPTNHNSIYGLLDEFGKVWSDDLGTYVERAEKVLVIATANVGEDNIGVFPMDAALIDRLPFQFELAIPKKQTLAKILMNRVAVNKSQAMALAELCEEISRKVPITLSHNSGTRPLVAAGKLMTKGLDFASACSYTVAATYSKEMDIDSERTIVENLITGIAGRLESAELNGQEYMFTFV